MKLDQYMIEKDYKMLDDLEIQEKNGLSSGDMGRLQMAHELFGQGYSLKQAKNLSGLKEWQCVI